MDEVHRLHNAILQRLSWAVDSSRLGDETSAADAAGTSAGWERGLPCPGQNTLCEPELPILANNPSVEPELTWTQAALEGKRTIMLFSSLCFKV